ncbi:MAG: sulfite exporter TauE/SafE family protein [Flavisolibacter sp.]|nr:sulfite exporter TauE/SafE family protein [Flavisolibacter sp.]
MPTLSAINWLLIFIAAFVIGLSKAGLKGIDLVNIAIMAIVFGGKASTGIVLPLLCLADVFAVIYYHRHAQWKQFWKLIPWIIIGILIGVYTGRELNETIFRKVMAVIIIVSVMIMLWTEIRKTIRLPSNRLFAATMGSIAGFTSMLGNLAGAYSNLYFLAMRMPKNNFIGTAAWLFLIINFLKLPFQIIYWKNIDLSSLQTDLILLPAMVLGFLCGIKIVAKIKDESYRKIVIALTLAGALMIFLKR